MGWLFKTSSDLNAGGISAIQTELDQMYEQVESEMESIAREEQAAHDAINELHAAFKMRQKAEIEFYDTPTEQSLKALEQALRQYDKAVKTYNKTRVTEDHWFSHFKQYCKKMEKYLLLVKQRRLRQVDVR